MAQNILPSLTFKDQFKQKYKIQELLGKGNFGEVYAAVNKKTKERVAVKMLSILDADEHEYAKKEMEVMSKLNHANIVRLIEMFEVSSPVYARKKHRKMCVVMELATGGELLDKIVAQRIFSEAHARSYIRTVLEVLEYMHAHGVVHRDLKPENILFADDSPNAPIKIADFGLSQLCNADKDQKLTTICGTPEYVAPEVLLGRGYNGQVDVWATGVILHILLSARPPFYHSNKSALFRAIVKGKFKLQGGVWDSVSDDGKDLLSKLLKSNPNRRLTPTEALKHPWFQTRALSVESLGSTAELREYQEQRKVDNRRRSVQLDLPGDQLSNV